MRLVLLGGGRSPFFLHFITSIIIGIRWSGCSFFFSCMMVMVEMSKIVRNARTILNRLSFIWNKAEKNTL